jgi:hypothetical protein
MPYFPFVPLDAGADSGSVIDGGNQDTDGDPDGDPGFDAAIPDGDSGQTGADGDAGDPLDGSSGGDASVSDDGSVQSDSSVEGDAGDGDAGAGDDDAGADAGEADAGGDSDAGPTEDAGPGSDAGGETDAGSCGSSGLVAGNDCPGVVSCQDNNGSNVPVLSCGLATHNCCVNTTGGNNSNSCRTQACSGFGIEEATCDGPEDCSGGQLCCFNDGATSCENSCNNNAARLCHTDADCPNGLECQVGREELFTLVYEWWGFCRQ